MGGKKKKKNAEMGKIGKWWQESISFLLSGVNLKIWIVPYVLEECTISGKHFEKVYLQ